MTIWILTLVLIASLAGIGFRQGAIRVAFSLGGIILGALLASPIGHLITPLIRLIGIKNPIWGIVLGPLIVFLIVLIAFKVAGATMDRRVNARFKHKESDFKWALWDRLNHRLGLCLGVANGTVYLMLACFAIYTPTYWTYQIGQSEEVQKPFSMKVLNRLGADLQKTGMNKVAGAVNTMPDAYYDAGDIVGLVYNNPLLTDRLARYPDFISLAEKPEFQELANDPDLAKMRTEQVPISTLLADPKVKMVLNNKPLMDSVLNMLGPDLKDLRAYLESGKSAKYDSEKLLGAWQFDPVAATAAFRKTKPTVTLAEMQRFRQWMSAFLNATFAAGPDHTAVLKGVPNPVDANQTIALRGEWKPAGTDFYTISFKTDAGTQDVEASIESGRLTVAFVGYSLGFIKTE